MSRGIHESWEFRGDYINSPNDMPALLVELAKDLGYGVGDEAQAGYLEAFVTEEGREDMRQRIAAL